METNTMYNEGPKVKRAVGTSIKTNKIIAFCINALLLLPLVIKHYSPIVLAATAVLLLIALYIIVFKSKDSVPASAYLTTLAFFDFCVYIGLNYAALQANYNPNSVKYVLSWLLQYNKGCLYLLGIGVAIGLVGLIKRGLSWLTGLSGAAIGSSVILLRWSNCNFKNISFTDGGEALLAVFLLSVLIWTILFEISVIIAPEKRKKNICLGIIQLCGVVFLNLTELSFIRHVAAGLSEQLLKLPHTSLGWWMATCVMLIACAVIMFNGDFKKNQLGTDPFVMAASGIFVIAAKILMDNYFIYNWLLMLLLIISTLVGLKHEIANKKTFRLGSAAYLAVQTVVFLAAVKAFKAGLWVNVLVTLLFVMLFYSQYERMKSHQYRNLLWISIISCITAEALAWQWKMGFAAERCIMLAMIYIVAVFVLLIINYPHPEKVSARNSLRVCICVCVALLCLLSMRTTVKIETETQGEKARISVEAKGRANEIDTVTYCWKNCLGQEIKAEKDLIRSSAEIPIEGDILSIVATDANGVQTTQYFWYPFWLHSFGNQS